MKKRVGGRVLMTPLPCPCGGTMRPVRMSRHDISAELGIKVTLVGEVLGLECERCGAIAIPGPILEAAVEMVVWRMLELERCFSGREAQFLRKTVLGCSQAELAKRMGLSRPTVARWEAAQSLSPDQDFNFRALLIGHILRANRLGGSKWGRPARFMMQIAQKQLQGARHKPAPKRIPSLEIRPAA